MDKPDRDEGRITAAGVEDAEAIVGLVLKVIETRGAAAKEVYSSFRALLYQYQEQSHMLDPLLSAIVVPLSKLLRELAIASHSGNTLESSLPTIAFICRLLHVLVMVRGHKAVVKHFPHEAADLERVVSVLLVVRAATADATSNVNETEEQEEWRLAVWETQSTLLLWLSILITIPFDLATVDSSHTQNSESSVQPYTRLVANILQLCQDYLSQPGSVRDMSALLLGRLLTRPDQGAALKEFLVWCQQMTNENLDAPKASFLIPGIMCTLAGVAKLGKRAELLPHALPMWQLLTAVADSKQIANNVLSRKLLIKLCQRLGTIFLKPKLAQWRYTQTIRLLSAHGVPGSEQGEQPAEAVGGEEEGDEFEIPEEAEEVLGRLLGALHDKDTVVRWCAAKGLARVTGCLPHDLGDELVGSVLELFKSSESDNAWHGGCLALAELARRGLLLPTRLPDVVPIIQQALQYDVRRGPCSIGSHVRDGAAYVCWAFARAYAPSVLAPSVNQLASALLTMACYDREVNCRRAAAAAFQESVGRLGNFPHGIDIIQVADYFAIGLVNQAYLKVGPFVASFPEYKEVLADHLLHFKTRHWEKSLRELTAKGLAALAPTNRTYLEIKALPYLLNLTLDSVLEVRHGAVVAVSELLVALHSETQPLSADLQAKVASIMTDLEQARLYRGKGGELMREATAHLIDSCSTVHLSLSDAQHKAACSTVEECLKHPLPTLQAVGVRALSSYSRAYPEACSSSGRLCVPHFAAHAHDRNVAVRRGCILGLGALPCTMLQDSEVDVIKCLCDALKVEDDVTLRDVESRVNAVKSLSGACQELLKNVHTRDHVVDAVCTQVFPALHVALQDYSTDNRGDVGSWVREAAMQVMVTLVEILIGNSEPGLTPQPAAMQLVPGIISALLKQAVERIARIRECAIKLLQRTTSNSRLKAAIPAFTSLQAALPTAEVDVEGVVSLGAVSSLASLLTVPEYRATLLEGLVTSAGCIDNSLAQAAASALVDTVTSQQGLLESVAQLLLHVWKQHPRSARLSSPILRTLHLLCSRTDITRVTLAGGSFASLALDHVKREMRQCSDVVRLLDAANALCQLCTCPEPVRTQALCPLIQLLSNRYPKVRKHTAEQLYLQLVSLEEEDNNNIDWEDVENTLLFTAWDGSIEQAHEACEQLGKTFNIQTSAWKTTGKSSAAQKAPVGTTYQSLLDDAARGGGY